MVGQKGGDDFTMFKKTNNEHTEPAHLAHHFATLAHRAIKQNQQLTAIACKMSSQLRKIVSRL